MTRLLLCEIFLLFARHRFEWDAWIMWLIHMNWLLFLIILMFFNLTICTLSHIELHYPRYIMLQWYRHLCSSLFLFIFFARNWFFRQMGLLQWSNQGPALWCPPPPHSPTRELDPGYRWRVWYWNGTWSRLFYGKTTVYAFVHKSFYLELVHCEIENKFVIYIHIDNKFVIYI